MVRHRMEFLRARPPWLIHRARPLHLAVVPGSSFISEAAIQMVLQQMELEVVQQVVRIRTPSMRFVKAE